MHKYRVAYYYNTDCRAEEFVTASHPVTAIVLANDKDQKVYGNWCNSEGFYIIVERVF